jgi:NDP-sugar pyrophosphorylase family protein
VDAIVMAAGEGSRLRPLTEVWPKPILPIDGRPVIATLLRELGTAGLTRVTLVTGHLAEQVEALVGDGSGFEVEVRAVRQTRPEGSADAVRTALDGGASTPAIVVVADTVYVPGEIVRFAAAFAASGADGAVAVRAEPDPDRPEIGFEPGGRVSRLLDDSGTPLASAALWGLGPAVTAELDGLRGPPYELAEAYQRAVDRGARVIAVEIGPTRDLTHSVDLIRENFTYLSKET